MTRTKRPAKQGTLDYVTFLQSLNVSWIALVESKLSVDRDRLLKDESPNVAILWKGEATMVEKTHFEAKASFIVRVDESKGKKELAHFEGDFLIHIHSSHDIRKAHVERFTNSEVRLVIWPYVREYVSTTCNRMFIPPIFLPLTGGSEEAG
jgi:preprotein translocase subunit SecB